jgi:hypothetical protein
MYGARLAESRHLQDPLIQLGALHVIGNRLQCIRCLLFALDLWCAS